MDICLRFGNLTFQKLCQKSLSRGKTIATRVPETVIRCFTHARTIWTCHIWLEHAEIRLYNEENRRFIA